jgi:hypothetical protein
MSELSWTTESNHDKTYQSDRFPGRVSICVPSEYKSVAVWLESPCVSAGENSVARGTLGNIRFQSRCRVWNSEISLYVRRQSHSLAPYKLSWSLLVRGLVLNVPHIFTTISVGLLFKILIHFVYK